MTMHDGCHRMQDPAAGAWESKQGLHQTDVWNLNKDWCHSKCGKRGQQECNVNSGSERHPKLHQDPIWADIYLHFRPATRRERML